MSAKNDGGPAFPGMDYVSQDGKINPPGMTLRDYFAAAALQGMCAHTNASYIWPEMAVDAYAFADAMLAERTRKEQP